MYCNNEVMVCLSGEVHGDDTSVIREKLKEKKPKYFILWQVGESGAPQFKTHLNHDFIDGKKHSDIIEFEKILLENNTKFYFVVGSDNNDFDFLNFERYPVSNFHILYWPTFLLHYTYYLLITKYNSLPEIDFKNGIENLFINYNNKSKIHRAKLIDELCKKDLLKNGTISWHGTYREMMDYDFECWEEKIIKIDNYTIPLINSSHVDSILDFKSLINLVSETSYFHKSFFITEKTFKPIFLNQIFISLGACNQNTNLKKYGFQLYDELFDYSFEKDENLEKRIEGIVENILKFENMNYNQIYDSVFNKINYNRNKAIDIVKDDPFIPNEILELYNIYGDEFLRLFDNWNRTYSDTYPFTRGIKLFDEIFKTKKI